MEISMYCARLICGQKLYENKKKVIEGKTSDVLAILDVGAYNLKT